MSDLDDPEPAGDPVTGGANTTGKRYTCSTCNSQVICVKGGAGRIHCHGAPMALDGARPLPSSD